MKSFHILVFLIGCGKNPDRIEEMKANNGLYNVKKYFENNSKIKVEVYDVKNKFLLTRKEFNKGIATKITDYFPNQKVASKATLFKKPNFFNVEVYYRNGKVKSEGTYLYNSKIDKLIPISIWLCYNFKTDKADSILHYITEGNTSIIYQVEKFDENNKITKVKYFDIRIKDSLKDPHKIEFRKIK